jgi:hypothetical protein
VDVTVSDIAGSTELKIRQLFTVGKSRAHPHGPIVSIQMFGWLMIGSMSYVLVDD